MCTDIVKHSKIKIEENKRKAIFENPQRQAIEVSRVDGCLIKSGIRCDNLVSDESVSVLIELKGSDVNHACNQLFTAATHVKVTPLLRDKVGFLVIYSKYPRFDTFVRKAKDRAAKEFGTGFHVVSNNGIFCLDKVAKISGPY